MPITISKLIEEVGLSPDKIKKVRWNEQISSNKEGVYIVSLSSNKNENQTSENIPISEEILKKWIKKMDGFIIDGELTHDWKIIKERLSRFWLPDENILYIGKAALRNKSKGIGNRVNEFYKTEYGERAPHAGGHWIKTLSILDKTFVYYIECEKCEAIEDKMLSTFEKQVSETSRMNLYDKEKALPFANIEDGKKQRKRHGLKHMKKERQ